MENVYSTACVQISLLRKHCRVTMTGQPLRTSIRILIGLCNVRGVGQVLLIVLGKAATCEMASFHNTLESCWSACSFLYSFIEPIDTDAQCAYLNRHSIIYQATREWLTGSIALSVVRIR